MISFVFGLIKTGAFLLIVSPLLSVREFLSAAHPDSKRISSIFGPILFMIGSIYTRPVA
jgi:hypothetical protein